MADFAPALTDPPLSGQKILVQMNKHFASLIATSFGVVAALSWNDAIKTLFRPGGMFGKVGHRGVWYTALFTTFVAFLVTAVVSAVYPDQIVSPQQQQQQRSPQQALIKSK